MKIKRYLCSIIFLFLMASTFAAKKENTITKETTALKSGNLVVTVESPAAFKFLYIFHGDCQSEIEEEDKNVSKNYNKKTGRLSVISQNMDCVSYKAYEKPTKIANIEIADNGEYTVALEQANGKITFVSFDVDNLDNQPPANVSDFIYLYYPNGYMILFWTNPTDEDYCRLILDVDGKEYFIDKSTEVAEFENFNKMPSIIVKTEDNVGNSSEELVITEENESKYPLVIDVTLDHAVECNFDEGYPRYSESKTVQVQFTGYNLDMLDGREINFKGYIDKGIFTAESSEKGFVELPIPETYGYHELELCYDNFFSLGEHSFEFFSAGIKPVLIEFHPLEHKINKENSTEDKDVTVWLSGYNMDKIDGMEFYVEGYNKTFKAHSINYALAEIKLPIPEGTYQELFVYTFENIPCEQYTMYQSFGFETLGTLPSVNSSSKFEGKVYSGDTYEIALHGYNLENERNIFVNIDNNKISTKIIGGGNNWVWVKFTVPKNISSGRKKISFTGKNFQYDYGYENIYRPYGTLSANGVTVPKWMLECELLLSDEAFGSIKTIGDLVSHPKSGTKLKKVNTTEDELTLEFTNSGVSMKITFYMNQNTKKTYISYIDANLYGQHLEHSSYGMIDVRNYGYCVGVFTEMANILFE